MIVVDASALVELLLGAPRARRLAARLATARVSLHAPHLIDVEVASVFRTLEAKGTISSTIAASGVADLVALDLTRYAHDVLMPRIWQLRGHVTSYDAAYVALAEVLHAPLVTFDTKLAAAPGHRAKIELYP